MYKKIVLSGVLASTLLLSGCLGGEAETESVGLVLPEANYAFYSSPEIQIQYPINWKVSSKEEISSKYKESIEVAFTSNFKDPFFTPTLTIEKIKAPNFKSSEEFADDVIKRNANSIVQYAQIEKQTVSTSIGSAPEITTLVRFGGKQKLQDDPLEYIQLFLLEGETGYIATAAYDPTDDNNEADKLIEAIRTFRLK
jgi:hypothetical protein